jgi:hypothetical protein
MSRGKSFEIGNTFGKGRPKGSRNKSTSVRQKLLEEHTTALTLKCISMAMHGDMKAMRMCLGPVPPLRSHNVKLGRSETVEEILQCSGKLIRMISKGDCPSAEGQVIANLLKQKIEMLSVKDIESKLQVLETSLDKAA